MTDDQSYTTIHAMGNAQAVTPNLDQLLADGVRFDRNYATTSISMASRACLMSGMYEYKTGCNFMRGAMTTDKFAKSYPVLLRDNGYYTAFGGKFGFAVTDKELNGKVGYANDYLPKDQFDAWAGQGHTIQYETERNANIKQYAKEYPHVTRALGQFGKDQIKAATATGKPFCISLYFKAPHGTFTPDPMFDDIYRDTVFRKPPTFGEEFGEGLATQAKLGRQRMEYYGFYLADYQNTTRRIYQLIYGVDYVLGELRAQLKECGVDENTIIIFTSDNGYSLGEKGLGGKVLPYEEGSRVPLIIYDPANTKNAGKATSTVTGNIDITATIMDYAGLEKSPNMDGVSLRGVINDPEHGKARESLMLLNTWGNPHIVSCSVVTDDWKFNYWPFGQGIAPAEELYAVTDRDEQHNLADNRRYEAELKKMQSLYDKQLKVLEQEVVPTTDYPTLVTIYDRHIPWSTKQPLFTQEQWGLFDIILKNIDYTGDKSDFDAIIKQNTKMDLEREKAGTPNPHTGVKPPKKSKK